MFSVLVYDIPSDEFGVKRRRKLYNICSRYGYHVQSSVFEFDISYNQMIRIQHDIELIIDKLVDSVRIYNLGSSRTDTNVVVLGKSELCESNDDCFLM